MTDRSNSGISKSPFDKAPADAPRRGWKASLLVAGALAVGLAGAAATTALSGGFGPGAWHAGGFGSGPIDPAEVDERVERMVKHLAVEIDATPEQQDRLVAIAQGAAKDLLPMRDRMKAAREEAHAILTAPTVDRAAIEALRARQAAGYDEASRRLAQALGDAAEVLTAEQRAELGERMERFRGRWHRG
jgi:periplasmic protein CpxP/Spy